MKTNNLDINSITNSIVRYLCTVLMVLGVSINAWGATTDFSYTDLVGQGDGSPGGAFLGVNRGAIALGGVGNGDGSYVQIYQNGTLTFTPLEGATISSISLTATTSSYARTWDVTSGGGSVEVSDATITWSGTATSTVTLRNTYNGQARITAMSVSYTYGSTYDAEWYVGDTKVQFDDDAVTVTPPDVDDDALGGSCSSLKFMGWSETEIGSTPTTRPSDLFVESVVLNGNKTFYAVFANSTEDTWEITEIDKLSGSGSGYAPYDGEHTADGMTYTSSDVMEQSSKIQFKENAGYIYNTTAFSNPITRIEIISVIPDLRVYTASSEISSTPASGAITRRSIGTTRIYWDFSNSNTFFHIKGGMNIPAATSIKVYYGTVSDYVTKCAPCSADPAVGDASLNGDISSNTSVDVQCSSADPNTNCSWSDYGFVWGTATAPTIGGSGCTKVQVGTSGSATSFTGSLSGSFTAGTTYYYRAYGKNSKEEADFVYSTNTSSFVIQSVTFNSNGGSAVSTKYVQSGGTITAPSEPSKTGYDFDGWYTDNGTWENAVSWSATISENKTYYAKWTAKTCILTLDKNNSDVSGTDDGEASVDYDATVLTSISHATRTGYHVTGYWEGASTGNQVLEEDGDFASSTVTNWITSNKWSKDATSAKLYARWEANTHRVSVAETDYVDIDATPDGGSKIEEGGYNESVAYGTEITLAHGDPESGYYWGGWEVTKDEDGSDVTTSCVAGNTLTMPDYDVTVRAMMYGDLKAWCPVITLEPTDGVASPILITSVRGQSVKAVRTLHLTVSGAASAAAVVTLSGTDLEFYKSDGTKITETNLTCSSYALDATITVAFNPSGDYSDDNWAAPDITASCSSTDVILSDLVNVRRLPDNGTSTGQGFVIAAEVEDGVWVALPAAMSAGAQDGLPINVDNDEDPTEATYAPTSARYNLYNVYASNGGNDRHKVYGTYTYLAGSGTKALKAAATGTSLSLGVNVTPGTYSGGAANPDLIEWLLSTTDKKNYTLTNNGRSAQLKYYTTNDKFGMYSYESSVITQFRLLPATFYTEAPMQVVEWKANSVVVMYTGSETTATTKVGSNDASSSQTLSNNKLTHGIYELTTDQALTSNDGATLEISFGDGSTRKLVEIPIIITGNTTAAAGHEAQDVIICNGGKLTAAADKYDYYNVFVYGGGKLNIPASTSLGVNNIIMRAGGLSTGGIGSSPSATYQYVYPQVGLIGTLTSAEADIKYEYITDYGHWYQLCLPFDGTLSTIHYPHEYYGDNVEEDNHGSWEIDRYAGEKRATGNYDAWVDIESESATSVTAGHGYLYFGAPKKVSVGGATAQRQAWGIQRISMPIADFDEAATAEANDKVVSGLGSYSAVDGNSGKLNDQGWNLIGNPYMVNLEGLTSTSIKTGMLIKELANDVWTGKWVSNGDALRYVTVPSPHFDTYTAHPTSWFTSDNPMVDGTAFFVQIDGEATAVTFDSDERAALLPAWRRQAEEEPSVNVETGIVMSDETHTDEVNFWIKEGKTEAYEYNADYPKMLNTTQFNIYGVHEVGELSWVAISPQIAEGSMAIGYQVPSAGEYTLSLSDTYNSGMIDSLLVTDHAVSPEITTDLKSEAYNFYVSQAETNNIRFTVSIKLRDPNQTATPIENVIDSKQKETLKFIYQDNIYILRNGIIYDVTGKHVKGGKL